MEIQLDSNTNQCLLWRIYYICYARDCSLY